MSDLRTRIRLAGSRLGRASGLSRIRNLRRTVGDLADGVREQVELDRLLVVRLDELEQCVVEVLERRRQRGQ